jgi:two-component system sensor histidine kinase NreB
MLTGLGFTLGMGTVEGPRLGEAQRIVAELTERVRDRSMELRPATLDSYGLLPAVLWHLERYQRQTGIEVELLQEGLDRRFSPPVEITAYRIVQEALTNVARHSASRSAKVQLFADDVALTVSVRDHGRGFGIASNNGGSGMAGMRERAELLGGTLEIDTAPGEGVTLTAELPLHLPLEFPTLGAATREEA